MARILPLLVLAMALSATTRAASLDSSAAFNGTIKPFIQAHCVDCHGPDLQKAALRLDNLPPDFRDEKSAGIWIHVLDKLVAGEMPPKKKARPAQKDLDAATQFLRTQLYAASLDMQQKKGRVIVRRLNGTEYENTVRDLLGINIPLKEMLPEDNVAAGFDNVSTALDLSANHILLYQDAAEKAINAAIPYHPPIPFSDKRTGLEMTKKGSNFAQGLGRNSKLDGEALIIYSRLPRYGLCSSASVPAAGRYKVSMSACAVGGNDKPIAVGYFTVYQSGRESPELREVHEIAPGKPQLLEFEFDLEKHQAFVVNLMTMWDIRIFKKPIDEYKGLGVKVEWIKVEGPIEAFPPASYQTLYAGVPLKPRSVVALEAENKKTTGDFSRRLEQHWANDPLVPASTNPRKDADRLIRDFLPRAFRRPVSESEQKHFVDPVLAKLDQKFPFHEAMMFGYKLILSSPEFLFLMDSPKSSANQQGDLLSPRLDDYSLAERLSYFLWSTAPDQELLAAAGRGELNKPAILHAQVERMLNSPKAHRFTKSFAGQWLDLRKIDATIPDPQLFGDFDYLLLWAMPIETELFFEEVLRSDRSLLDFVHSDWTILNERLATQYGIPGVTGNDFRLVKLPEGSHRGGVMTQASVLKVTADGTRTSPVLRGKWILERIIGKPPAAPPPDVPTIEPDIRGATTIRQQLDKHRNTPACAACHTKIDPPGFALETYDPIGNWRDFYRVTTRPNRGMPLDIHGYNTRPIYRGPDVEKGDKTPEGRPFKDIDEYKRILLEDKDQLARNLVQKMIVYSTGADIQFADREVVEQIVANLRTKNYGFRTLVHEVVQSRIFVNK